MDIAQGDGATGGQDSYRGKYCNSFTCRVVHTLIILAISKVNPRHLQHSQAWDIKVIVLP